MIRTQLERVMSSRGMRRTYLAYCLALGIVVLFTNIVSAGSVGTSPPGQAIVTVTGVRQDGTNARSEIYRADIKNDNTFSLSHSNPDPQPGVWNLTELSASGNIDPFTNLNWAITNNAAVTLLFSVSVTLPIAPQGPATLHGGSTGATLNDANFNGMGAVSTFGATPFYQGQIDGVTVLPIYPAPFTHAITFPGQTTGFSNNVGLPGPTLPSGPALLTIGIINTFTLTPGDSLSGNSFFVIVPVPEPSTIALVTLGVMTWGSWRRKR
jgi:hypothetical protein